MFYTIMWEIPSNKGVQSLPKSMLTLFHTNKVHVKSKQVSHFCQMFPFSRKPLCLFIMHDKFELQQIISPRNTLYKIQLAINQLLQNVTRCVRKPHGWELDTTLSFLMMNQFIFVTVGYQASLFHLIPINLQ